MRRLLVYILLLILCQFPMMAQSIAEADSIMLANAFMLNKAGKQKEALEGFLKVGQNTKKQRTEDERQMYVLSQTMAVMCYESLKQYEDGFRLSEELLKGNINDEERKDIQHLYVMNGYFVATSYISKSNHRYADARDILASILTYADDDMKLRIQPKIPLSWYFEGTVYKMHQMYDEALPCIEEARKGFHELGEIKNEIDATCQIANIKNEQFNTYGALKEYQKAERLAQGGQYDAKLMDILKELRSISNLIGDSELSLKVAMQIDSLVALTADDNIKFDYYSYKGREAKEHGNYNLSEHWYLMNEQYVQQLADDYIGADKYLYYTYLRDLYTNAGKYDEALKYAGLSKKEFQRTNGADSSEYFMPYLSFAYIYRLKGDSIKCFAHLDTLFMAMNRLSEPKMIQYLYTTRAGCYTAFKDNERALADYKEADRLLATKYQQNDGERLKLLPLMGGAEHRLMHYDESERLYRLYAEGMRNLHGENSSEYIDALYYLANAEGFAGHIEEACKHYSLSIEKNKMQIRSRLPYYTVEERESYWNTKSETLRNMTPFAIKAEQLQTGFTKDCYDGLVLSKSFLLESERSTYDVIKNGGTAEDLHDIAMIAAMQAKIRGWERDYNQYADSILDLTSEAETLEKRLTDRCRSYGDITSFMSFGYEKIKEKLNDGDVLIDFTDFVSESRGRIYAAYLVNNKQDNPLLQELFAESKIDSMLVAYPDQYYESPYAEAMYQFLWMPFKDKVAEGATVYYVPSQLLFQIALESLPMEDGTLLGDHYHFVRLSSARELANLDTKLDIDLASDDRNAVLYGGLLYDLEANEWEVEAKQYDVSSLLAVRGDILRGDSIPLLPGSKKEVDEIEQILKSHNLKVESYTGKRGTEESFLSMSGKAPQILHVATHGFFYTPDEAQEIDYLRGYEDAMSLSGLIMSGGNAAWRGKELPQGVLGGILTASNIARLDLNKNNLTVLSACQSGKGQATPEVLYGLQRAFKKAGVKTMIMSLWYVSDVVGTEFMNIFYENLLDEDNHYNKRKAFDKAKSAIREKYSEPFYWACFVMLD